MISWIVGMLENLGKMQTFMWDLITFLSFWIMGEDLIKLTIRSHAVQAEQYVRDKVKRQRDMSSSKEKTLENKA